MNSPRVAAADALSSAERLRADLQALCEPAGVMGCALVEVETGMVWHHAGRWAHVESFGESAVEFWRLQDRHRQRFAELGDLRSSVFYFQQGSVALLPCPCRVPVVLVCVADRQFKDWAGWMGLISPLFARLKAL